MFEKKKWFSKFLDILLSIYFLHLYFLNRKHTFYFVIFNTTYYTFEPPLITTGEIPSLWQPYYSLWKLSCACMQYVNSANGAQQAQS